MVQGLARKAYPDKVARELRAKVNNQGERLYTEEQIQRVLAALRPIFRLITNHNPPQT